MHRLLSFPLLLLLAACGGGGTRPAPPAAAASGATGHADHPEPPPGPDPASGAAAAHPHGDSLGASAAGGAAEATGAAGTAESTGSTGASATSGGHHPPDGAETSARSLDEFLVPPYLQLGTDPTVYDRLVLLWLARDGVQGWAVEVANAPGAAWVRMPAPESTLIGEAPARRPVHGGHRRHGGDRVAGGPRGRRHGGMEFHRGHRRLLAHPIRREPLAHRVWTAQLGPLVPGTRFRYRVLRDGVLVFSQEAMARKKPGQAQRVAVAGDLVEGTASGRAIAYQIHAQNPDLMVGIGDLVYPYGRISDYRSRFFPIYNADRADPAIGAPVMRSRLMVGVLGNHDVGDVRRDQVPPRDSLAYYFYWNQPLDGPPDLIAGGHALRLDPPGDWEAFRTAAGNRYPQMGSFTFRSGDVHWTILDSNRYLRWSDPNLKAWLERELAAAQDAHWRFVAFHHAAFNLSGYEHTRDWQMRQLWPILQRYHVDLVFTGHPHTYQRTRPLGFTPVPGGADEAAHLADDANIVVDTEFDGATHTRTAYPIHILTGAGGGFPHRAPMPAHPKPYAAKLVSGSNGFSLLDITADRIEFKQLDATGAVKDSFILTK